MRRFLLLATLALVLPVSSAHAGPKPVKVVILAGQSNMEGKAKISLLNYQAEQPATKDLYKHWRDDDRWVERDDVSIKFLDRHGNLTVGFGSPNCIGPELELGTVLGDHYDEPVLLIKTAWGGRSLFRDFRPPSAGLPDEQVLKKMLVDLQKRTPNATLEDVKAPFGASYRAMLADIRETLSDLKTYVPGYEGQGYKVIGFVWFQGWNDMINGDYTAAYTDNMQLFIRDVRKDLELPKLPFVIGQMGVDGLETNENVKRFKAAQAAAAEDPAFKGNVLLVKTDAFWDTEAEAVYKKGWREHIDEWNKVGSDYPFHYLGSGKTMLKIGRAFGEAVLALQGDAG